MKKKERDEENKKKEEEEKKKKEDEEKKKKEEEEKIKKEEEDKKKEEEKKVKEEDKKEENKALAQRAVHGVKEVDISSSDNMSIQEEQSSSEDSMDCRESRSKQKGRGQDPKLEFGPSKLEMVREEETKKNAAANPAAKKAPGKPATKKAAKKEESAASSSSSTAPAADATTSLDKREEAAPTPLAQRETLKPEIAIDHHNALEAHGHIYPQSIRQLDLLREMGYKVHLVSFCGEERFEQVHREATGAWGHWEPICRTNERVGRGWLSLLKGLSFSA
eukprot:s586_g27.t1